MLITLMLMTMVLEMVAMMLILMTVGARSFW